MVAAAACTPVADRYEHLGHEMICICGCNQLLASCTMINCPASKPMQAELRTLIADGKSDNDILATFVDKYGKRVLAAPPKTDWFNLSAWVLPFAALGAGAIVTWRLLRSWKAATATTSATPAVDPSKYQAEIEEELKRLTPED
jgi:cytochrome c-type biogenesis protein CcmH